jgi:hypothetical protein
MSLSALQRNRKAHGQSDGRHLWPIWFRLIKECNLQSSLANRLGRRLPLDGWMKSLMTLREKITPSRRLYYQLVLLVHPIKEIGYSLWPTANARDQAGFSNVATRQQSSLPRNVAVALDIQSGARGTANLNWLCWYMGFPQMWLQAKPSEMPSSPKLPLSS